MAYLGAKNRFEGLYPSRKSGYGGFNLGNVQGSPPVRSSVASPNPASAGVSGSPSGGMRVGPYDENQVGGGPAAPTDAGNANVTGFDAGLAGLGLSLASMGVPGLGAVTGPLGASLAGPVGGVLGSVAGGVAQNAITSQGLGAIPGSMSVQSGPNQGQQATYSGPTGPLGLAFSLLSGHAPSIQTADSTPFGLANSAQVNVPSPSPNIGFGVGVPGSTSLGPNVNPTTGPLSMTTSFDPGQHFSFSAPGQTGTTPGMFGSPAAMAAAIAALFGHGPKGNAEDNAHDPNESSNTGESGSAAAAAAAAVGEAAGEGGQGAGTAGEPGDAGSQGGPSTAGDGAASGVSGPGIGSAGEGFKRGGRIPPKRPSAKHLSDKLKKGARVNVGKKDSDEDDVPVNLQRGEFVVDRDSTRKYEPQLRKMNAWEPTGKGGMNVGFGRR